MSLRLVAGARVFVCDNLVLSGDMIVLRRKHTTGEPSGGTLTCWLADTPQ